jgi:hypothetical protein
MVMSDATLNTPSIAVILVNPIHCGMWIAKLEMELALTTHRFESVSLIVARRIDEQNHSLVGASPSWALWWVVTAWNGYTCLQPPGTAPSPWCRVVGLDTPQMSVTSLLVPGMRLLAGIASPKMIYRTLDLAYRGSCHHFPAAARGNPPGAALAAAGFVLWFGRSVGLEATPATLRAAGAILITSLGTWLGAHNLYTALAGCERLRDAGPTRKSGSAPRRGPPLQPLAKLRTDCNVRATGC